MSHSDFSIAKNNEDGNFQLKRLLKLNSLYFEYFTTKYLCVNFIRNYMLKYCIGKLLQSHLNYIKINIFLHTYIFFMYLHIQLCKPTFGRI